MATVRTRRRTSADRRQHTAKTHRRPRPPNPDPVTVTSDDPRGLHGRRSGRDWPNGSTLAPFVPSELRPRPKALPALPCLRRRRVRRNGKNLLRFARLHLAASNQNPRSRGVRTAGRNRDRPSGSAVDSGAGRKRVDRRVDVDDNDNESCASPVHHGRSIWQRFAASVSEAKPHGLVKIASSESDGTKNPA